MQRNLWDESKEASLFSKEVIDNIDKFKLFPEENFKKIIIGIFATSELDTQGDILTSEALQNITDQTNRGVSWMGAEHNPLIQTIGRVIRAKLFFAPKSQVYFIGAVIGYYDEQNLPSFKDLGVGLDKLESKNISGFQVDICENPVKIAFNEHEINAKIIENLLFEAPSYVDRKPIKSIRKAADPIVVISVIISLNFILSSFFKSYFGELGKKAAEATVDFLKWLKKRLTKEKYKLEKNIIFNFIVIYKDCSIEFAIQKREKELPNNAIDSLPSAVRSALSLIDAMSKFDIKRVVFEYNSNQGRWLPLHAITEKLGVVADKPTTIDIRKYRGLSFGGQIISAESNSKE